MYVVKQGNQVQSIGTIENDDSDLEATMQPPEKSQHHSAGNITKEIILTFEDYQKARLEFVIDIERLSNQSWNITTLHNGGVEELLKPLILDSVPTIQNAATLALAKVASHGPEMAETVAKGDFLHQLVYMMNEQSKPFKQSAAYLLRSVAKHSSKLAAIVVDSGGVETFVQNLDVFDPDVKEDSVWGLNYVCRHNAELAQAVVDFQGIPSLLLCVQEPELPLKRIAVSTLADICKHTRQLAQTVVEQQGIEIISPLLNHSDVKLRTQVCRFLAQIAKHNEELAGLVIERGSVFPYICKLMTHPDAYLKKNATVCVQVLTKHTEEFSSLVVQHNGLDSLVSNVALEGGSARFAAIIALGNIAGFSEQMSDAIISANTVPVLAKVLQTSDIEDYIKSFVADALGRIGHTFKQVNVMAKEGCLVLLVKCFSAPSSSDELKKRCKDALKQLIKECKNVDYLNQLLADKTPEKIFMYVLKQLTSILVADSKARRSFAKDKGLLYLQEVVQRDTTSRPVKEQIYLINATFPEEAVKFYTPNYDKDLLKSVV